MSGGRGLRRLWRSPYVVVVSALLFASGLTVVGTTLASFSSETDNNTSTFPAGWIGGASNGNVGTSGYDGLLTWAPGTHGGVTGQTVSNGLDQGATQSCPSSGYSGSTALGSATTASYTASNANGNTTLSAAITTTTSPTSITVASAAGFPSSGNYTILIDNEQMTVTAGQGTTTWTVTRGVNSTTAATHLTGAGVIQLPDNFDGHYYCYQITSTTSSSWTGTGAFGGQLGLFPTAITTSNPATTGKPLSGDSITITFNQQPLLLTTGLTSSICFAWSAGTSPRPVTIFLKYSTCATTNSAYQVELTGLTKATTTAGTSTGAVSAVVSTSAPWTITYTLTANPGGGPTFNTGTVTAIADGSWVVSNASTDRAPACASATYNCQPSGSTNW